MTHASLFSGIGGCEVAAAMLGWENVFHCEINPFGRAVLEYWFPNSKSYEDITKTSFKEWRGKIDVLTGGFPCQPFSYAGQRRGAEDDRYLWPQMLRAISEIRPTWVIGENVAGITTMVEPGEIVEVGVQTDLFGAEDSLHTYEYRQRYTLERVCADLESLGYSVQPIIIPACAVGAPHRRDRIFIVGHSLADSDQHHDVRDTRNDASEGRAERLQERNAVCLLGESNPVRPEGQGDALPNTDCDRTRTSGEGGEVKGSGSHPDQLSHQRSAETRWVDGFLEVSRPLEDSMRVGCQGRDAEREHSKQLGNTCPAGTDGQVRQSPSDTESKRGKSANGIGESCREEQMQLGRGYCTTISGGGQNYECGQRWAAFPTISPIHRGNDGIPFDVDCLTIPFNKWRQEALKAYGNAIVPQVVYEIFLGIERVTNES